MNETSIEREYKHFLRYDQNCIFDIEYGFTDLYFDINQTNLFVKKVDHSNELEKELQFPLKFDGGSVIDELEHFLITLMSDKNNFSGTPVYVQSEIFSSASFDIMLKKAIVLMDEKYALAVKLNADNEIIKYCNSIGLNPKPNGSRPNIWEANCLSRGEHQLMISTEFNEWGCGYCKKKGDINSLREWYESKKNVI
jgi:hypothetical protein